MSRYMAGAVLGLLLMAAAPAEGRPPYRALIPNGNNVPTPTGDGVCPSVGHTTCLGGGSRNAFGQDFQAEGFTWTQALCMKDSDGDGLTNGQELGDPCCEWVASSDAVPLFTDRDQLSHPGFKESTPAAPVPANCKPSAPPSTPTEKQGTSSSEGTPNASFFNEGEEKRVQHLRFDNTIPPTDTTYYLVPFNFDLAEGEQMTMVGFESVIDNKKHMHHYVVIACPQRFPEEMVGVAINEYAGNDHFLAKNGCFETFYLWAPGTDTWAPPKNVGFDVGSGTGLQSFVVQIHYDNPDEEQGLTDRSELIINYTPKPREHSMGILWPGSTVLNMQEIPQGATSWYYSQRCAVVMDPSVASEVTVFAHAPHMHYSGKRIWSEKIGTGLGTSSMTFSAPGSPPLEEMPRMDTFDASLQHNYAVNFTISAGDLIATTCVYDVSDREGQVRGGLGSWDEMCINFYMYYPKRAIPVPMCRGDRVDNSPPFYGEWPQEMSSAMELEPLATALLTPSPKLAYGYPMFTPFDPEGEKGGAEVPTQVSDEEVLQLPSIAEKSPTELAEDAAQIATDAGAGAQEDNSAATGLSAMLLLQTAVASALLLAVLL